MSVELFNVLSYHHQIVENVDITTTEPDWTDLISLTAVDMAAGLYALSFSLQFHLNSTSQSFLYRFSKDGGATWGIEYSREVKDRTNISVIEVFDLLETTAVETLDLRVQVTREGTANCEVLRAILACERKA